MNESLYNLVPISPKMPRWMTAAGIFMLCFILEVTAGHPIPGRDSFQNFIVVVSGVSASLIFLFGFQFWLVPFVAFLCADLFIGVSIPAAIMIAGGMTLHLIIVYFCSQKALSMTDELGYLAESIGLLGGTLIGSGIEAIVGVGAFHLNSSLEPGIFYPSLLTWWGASFLSVLILVPLTQALRKLFTVRGSFVPSDLANLVVVAILTGLVTRVVFHHLNGSASIFLALPVVLVGVVLMEIWGPMFSVAAFAAYAILFLNRDFGVAFSVEHPSLLNLQIFVGVLAVTVIVLNGMKSVGSLRLPGLVLVVSWAISSWVYVSSFRDEKNAILQRWDRNIQSVEHEVGHRFERLANILRGVAAFSKAAPRATNESWRSFLQSAGFTGSDQHFSTILFFPRADVPKKFQPQLIFGKQGSTLNPAIDSARAEQMFSDAMTARDLGSPKLSLPKTGFEKGAGRLTTWIFYPIYQRELPESMTQVERVKSSTGWIAAEFLLDEYFSDLFSKNSEDPRVRIYQGNQRHQKQLVFDSKPDERLTEFSSTLYFNIGETDFMMDWHANTAIPFMVNSRMVIIALCGSLFGLLLAGLLASLQSVGAKANQIAIERTTSLELSETRLAEAQRIAGLGRFEYDLLNDKVYWSAETYRILGRDRDDGPSNFDWLLNRLHADDKERIISAGKNCLENALPFDEEFRVERLDGSTRYVHSRGEATFDDSKKLIRFLGTVQDVSTTKMSEERLRRSEERFKLAVRGSADGLWDWNLETGELYYSPRFKSILGYDDRDFEDNFDSWENHLHPEDRERVLGEINEGLLSPGGGYFDTEFRLRHKHGHYRWCHAKGAAIFSEQQKPLRASGSLTDVTERKKAERMIEEQRVRILNASKLSSLGEMAGGIAHEINNPLAIISGKAFQLRMEIENQKFESEKAIVALNKIETTCMRIAKIIKGLKSFARNSEKDPFKPVPIKQVIENALELCQQRFKNREIDFKVSQIPEGSIECREAQIGQVLLNLLNNAFDAVENGTVKWIELDVRDSGPFIHMTVTDSGNGIPKNILDRIMEPFFTTKEVGKGTGLGLSISKGIIEDHNGYFAVDSKCPNTRFIVELPKEQSEKNKKAA